MAFHNRKPSLLLFLVFFVISSLLVNSSSSPHPPSASDPNLSSLKAVCSSTPYPDVRFDTLKLSISINISPNILTFLLHSIQTALSEAGKLSALFSNGHPINIVEKQKGTIHDCNELQQITISALKKSVSRISASTDTRKLADARAFLSAALTNKATCFEGLDSASGPSKPALINCINYAYKFISNSLSLLPKNGRGMHRRLMGFPSWVSAKDRRILQSSDDQYDSRDALIVAADGTGNFTSINDAINFAPNNSVDRIVIYIREGIYQENVMIPSSKPNIAFIGDGSDVTVITSDRSVGDGWTTFRSATVGVSGDGFLARDITIENTAGREKFQAVALRINADFAALYRCTIKGFQDTLYAHTFRQFYRECDIYGTIDYIFGNAAVVFQGCNIISRLPLPGQTTVITAQSQDDPDEYTGFSIQNCSILPTIDLDNNSDNVKSYLGRPWRNYSTVVFMESYIDEHIAPEGWSPWFGDEVPDTIYYGEYDNNGPGSVTDNRVNWPGFHIMDYYDASSFTVSELITGDEWLDSTSFPYDNGI